MRLHVYFLAPERVYKKVNPTYYVTTQFNRAIKGAITTIVLATRALNTIVYSVNMLTRDLCCGV